MDSTGAPTRQFPLDGGAVLIRIDGRLGMLRQLRPLLGALPPVTRLLAPA